MSFQPLGYRTPIDNFADYERAVHHHSDRDALHRQAIRNSRSRRDRAT